MIIITITVYFLQKIWSDGRDLFNSQNNKNSPIFIIIIVPEKKRGQQIIKEKFAEAKIVCVMTDKI